jgi:GNAT superfamily N-acetyltransferase
MQPLASLGEMRAALLEARRGAKRLVTNWFAADALAERWIARGALQVERFERCTLLYRADQDFQHLYFAAADADALASALERRGAGVGIVTADLIGRPDEALGLADLLASHGFRPHKSLVRMSRLAQAAPSRSSAGPEVVPAVPADTPVIHAFLKGLLDRFAEQLPQREDLEVDCAHGNVLVVRRGGELGGVLIFETTGVTSVLRYWFVNDRHRNQGIGAALIRRFFDACSASKRILLWVISDNHDSIAKYEHYRFQREGLVDHIMIVNGENAA